MDSDQPGEGCHLKLWDSPSLSTQTWQLYICAALEVSDSQGPPHEGTVRPAPLPFSGTCSQVCSSSPAIPKGFIALFPTWVVVSISWAQLMLAQLGWEHEDLSDIPSALERCDQGVTMSPRDAQVCEPALGLNRRNSASVVADFFCFSVEFRL